MPTKLFAMATDVIDEFPRRFEHHWLVGLRHKLGLTTSQPDDRTLATDWLQLLQAETVDFTLGWRHLADPERLRPLFTDRRALDAWLVRWEARLAREGEDSAERADSLRLANPIVIPRNHNVEAALTAAVDHDDLRPFERLLAAVHRPFDDVPATADLTTPAPASFTASYRTFCGT